MRTEAQDALLAAVQNLESVAYLVSTAKGDSAADLAVFILAVNALNADISNLYHDVAREEVGSVVYPSEWLKEISKRIAVARADIASTVFRPASQEGA